MRTRSGSRHGYRTRSRGALTSSRRNRKRESTRDTTTPRKKKGGLIEKLKERLRAVCKLQKVLEFFGDSMDETRLSECGKLIAHEEERALFYENRLLQTQWAKLVKDQAFPLVRPRPC